MKQVNRANGVVTFTLPEIVSDPEDIQLQQKKSGKRRGSSDKESVDVFSEEAVILSALEEGVLGEKDFDVIDSFSLDLSPVTKPSRRRRTTEPEEVQIDVELTPNEAAVILIEHEGTYEWHFPAKATFKRRSKRRGGPRVVEAKTAIFRIPIGEGEPPKAPRGMRRVHRGPITNFIKDKVKGFIMTFVTRKVVGAISRRLEKGVKAGPVIISSNLDTEGWIHEDDFLSVDLPKNRPARILLLVHGSFSSTLGSFGALTTYPAGQRFLSLCLQKYDAILGYDHYTLAENPAQNAEELFKDLQILQEQSRDKIEFDAISFSRGGLVYRYLTEQIVPLENTQLSFRKSIFVGCTNAGTELANDENWKHLADFYINMVAGGSRLLALFPGTRLPGLILWQSVQVIGSFVKYIAQDAVVDNGVPGLAAMEPDGSFVKAINKVTGNRKRAGARFYYAIGSNFEPDGETSAGKLGKALTLKVADGFIDRLMNESNDLVVNTKSMFVVDPVPSAKLLDSLPIKENGEIYHTVYFHQPKVANQCADWLGVAPTKQKMGAVNTPRSWWKGAVSNNFMVFSGEANALNVLKQADNENARFIVVERLYQNEILRYGVPLHELMNIANYGSADTLNLVEALNLHEHQSTQMSMGEALDSRSEEELAARSASGPYATVIVDDSGPVGVIAPPEPMATMVSDETFYESAGPPPRRRGETQENAGDEAQQPVSVWCYIHATMAEEVVIDKKATLTVTLSRDEIIRATGVSGGGEVDKDKDIIVQIIPRKHCIVSGESRLDVPVPAKGEEEELYFDVIPKHEGIGEIDVIARQGNRAIVKLKLLPRFVTHESGDVIEHTVARAEMAPLDNRPELKNVLYIDEGEMGTKQVLHFQFESETLKKRVRCTSEPFADVNARQDYIKNLYEEIEDFWAKNAQDYDGFMDNLRARGVSIFEELIPKELQQVLWDARETLETIQVFSSEPYIPWELAYLKEPGKKAKRNSYFLAEKGMVRWLADSNDYPPKALRLRDGKAAYIIPDYPKASRNELPGAQQERKMLETVLGAKSITPTSKAAQAALEAPGEFDIIHFACHGKADSESIWNAGLMMEGEVSGNRYLEDVLLSSKIDAFADMKEDDAPGPMVFLNACQVGRKGYSLTGTGGFAKAFINSGAGAFISTHWSVGDDQALNFSETFYKKLLAEENMMTAVAEARKSAKTKEDVTWLSYVVYADPYAKLVKE